MLKAFYFALNFAMIFLGVIIAIYVEAWIGLLIMGLFTVKFLLMFPDLNESSSMALSVYSPTNLADLLTDKVELTREEKIAIARSMQQATVN